MAAAAAAGGATLSPSPLDSVSTAAALDALLAWLRAQQKHRKAQLLEHDEPVQLLLSLRRIPSTGRTNPYLLPLPHPIHTSPSICLFLHDPCPLPPDTADSHLRSLPFPSSTKVIPLASLRSDYVPFEARRRLCGSFDLFFADRRILPLLPRLLGKVFFKKKKHPLRVDVARKGWLGQIRKGCSSARMHVGTGTCVHVDVGRVSMTKEEVLDNVAAVVDAAVRKIPKGWGNVRGVYLKLEDSVALPIYQALPEIGMKIKVPTKVEEVLKAKGEEKKKKKKGRNLDNSNDDDSKRGRRRKEKKLGEMRYMDAAIDREDSVGESEEDDGEVEGGGGKKRRKTRGKREEDEDGEIVGDVGGDGSGADLGEGERKSLKRMGKEKKKMVKKVKKEGEFDGAVGDSVESVGGGDGGEDGGEDRVVKSTGKKRKGKKKGKGEEAAEEVEDVLMVAGDIDVEDISKDDEECGVDHAVKSMGERKKKKKKDMKRKGEEAAEEVEDVSEVAKDGIGRTKGKAKSIVWSKELKKSKRKKVNG